MPGLMPGIHVFADLFQLDPVGILAACLLAEHLDRACGRQLLQLAGMVLSVVEPRA